MNIIVKIAVLIFTYIIFSSILKSYRPEYIFLLRIATVLLILIFSVDYLTEFITSYLTIFSIFNIDSAHISLLIKVVGIAILSDVISDNLKDTGEHSLSNIVILVSKFIILFLTLPIFNGIIIFCMKFIDYD